MTMNYFRVEDILETLAAEDLQNRSILVIDNNEKRAEVLPIETAKTKAISSDDVCNIFKYVVNFKLASFIIISNMKLKTSKITRNTLEFVDGSGLNWESDFYVEFVCQDRYFNDDYEFAKPLLSVEDIKEKKFDRINKSQRKMRDIIEHLDKCNCHTLMNVPSIIDQIRTREYIKLKYYKDIDIVDSDIIIDAYDYRVGNIDMNRNTCVVGNKLYRYEFGLDVFITNKEVDKSLSNNRLLVFTDGTAVFKNFDNKYDFTVNKSDTDEYIKLFGNDSTFRFYDNNEYERYISDCEVIWHDKLLDYNEYYHMPYPDDHMLYNLED